jgi:hypothetical protein
MGNPVQFLGWNNPGGGQRVINGDEYIEYNFTEVAPTDSPLKFQRSGSTVLELLAGGSLSVTPYSYTSNSVPALKITSSTSAANPFLQLYDSVGGNPAVDFSATKVNAGYGAVLMAYGNDANAVGFKVVADVNAATPAGKVFSFCFKNNVDAEIELFSADADKLTSHTDLIWHGDSGGNIGQDTTNRPGNIYAASNIYAGSSLHAGSDATYKTTLSQYSLLLSGASPGANNKIIYADDGTGTGNMPALQYDETTNRWQFRVAGGSFSNIGASTTWDDVYDNDADGLTVDTAAKPFAITQTSTTGSAFTVTRNLASNNTYLAQFTSTNASDNYPVVYISSSSTGSGYALSLNCAGADSIPLSISQPSSSSTYAISASSTIYTNRSYRGGDYSDSAVIGNASRTNAFTSSGRYIAGGSFQVTQGTGDTSTGAFYAGLRVECVPSATTAQSYGVKVDADFRVGSHYGSTVFDQWTSIDKSAIVIDTASYATADSYGIVFTSSASAQRPSNLLSTGSTALMVNGSWDYGLWTASCVSATGPATKDKASVQVSNTAPAALTSSDRRPAIRSTTTGNAGDTTTSYTDCFCASTVGVGSSQKHGFYADSTLDVGFNSESRVLVSAPATASSEAVYVRNSASTALGSGEHRKVIYSRSIGNASDNSGSFTDCFHAATTGTGSGIKLGLYADTSLDYGVYSAAKSYLDITSNATGTVAVQNWIRSSGMTGGTEVLRGVVSAADGHTSDVVGSVFYLFDAQGDSGAGSATHYGFHATGKCDIGVYSESRSLFDHQGDTVWSRGAIVAQTTNPAVFSLSSHGRSAIVAKPTANASDTDGSTVGFLADDSDINVGSSTKYGFYAESDWSAGFYSLSRTVVNYTNAGLSTSALIASSIINTTDGISGGTRYRYGLNIQTTATGTLSSTGIFCSASCYTTASSSLASGSYLVGYRAELQPYVSQVGSDCTYIAYDAEISTNNPGAGRIGLLVDNNYGVHETNSWSIKSEGGRALFQQTTSSSWTAPLTYDLVSSVLTSGGETNASDLFSAVRGTVIPSNSDTNNARFASLAADCSGASTGTSTYFGLYVSDAGSTTANMTKTGVRVYKWPASQNAIHVQGESSGEGGKIQFSQNWGTITSDQTHVEISTAASLSGAGVDLNCVKISATGSMITTGGGQKTYCLYLSQTESASDVTGCTRYGTYATFVPDATPAAICVAHQVDNTWQFGFVSSALTNIFSRLDGEYDNTNTEVLEVENLATGGTGTAHALTAKLNNSADGQFCVALENQAETGGVQETQHHIGFITAKSNRRVIPLEYYQTATASANPDYYFVCSGNVDYWESHDTAGTNYIMIPLMLPHKCSITQIDVHQRGNGHASSASRLEFLRRAHGSANWGVLATVNGTNGDTTLTDLTYTPGGSGYTIDCSSYAYMLRYRDNTGTGSQTARVYSTRVYYDIQDLGAAPGF